MAMHKDRRVDLAPLVFFAVIVALKTYYLIGYIQATEPLWEVIGDARQHAEAGQDIHILGVAILAATPAALALFFVAVALQAVRAKIEERKFLANVPAYAEFRRNTGFLWPKLF